VYVNCRYHKRERERERERERTQYLIVNGVAINYLVDCVID